MLLQSFLKLLTNYVLSDFLKLVIRLYDYFIPSTEVFDEL